MMSFGWAVTGQLHSWSPVEPCIAEGLRDPEVVDATLDRLFRLRDDPRGAEPRCSASS
jgi:hypothetical protein